MVNAHLQICLNTISTFIYICKIKLRKKNKQTTEQIYMHDLKRDFGY